MVCLRMKLGKISHSTGEDMDDVKKSWVKRLNESTDEQGLTSTSQRPPLYIVRQHGQREHDAQVVLHELAARAWLGLHA